MLASDLAKHLDSVHAWHIEIERNDVGLQLFQFLEAHFAVHRRSHYFDRRVVQQSFGNKLPHECRIVDNEDTCLRPHAIAPTAGILARRDTTAGMLRINTTVPSPRIDAPLTKGEAESSSSRALITSSSSPTRLSTARPNRRVPASITITNVRRALSTARGPRSSKRASVRTCSRSRNTSCPSTR